MNEPKVNVTLEQFCVVAALERLMSLASMEAGMLKAIKQGAMAEKLDSMCRHIAGLHKEFVRESESRLVIASAGVIHDLKATH